MIKIAIASCCKIQNVRSQPVWSDIESEDPDLLLLLGDNVYMNNSRWDHVGMVRRYQEQLAEPHFESLIKKVPFLATWDDHDFGINDSRGAHIKDAYRKESRRQFYKYMRDKSIWTKVKHPRRSGIFYSYDIEDIRIIMLDVRFYRTYSSRKNATMLGAKQEEWFWDQLDNDKRYTIVGTGTCVDTGAKNQTWKDYKMFYKGFSERIIPNDRVLVVSGDVHFNRYKNHGHFHEVISSGVGRPKKIKTRSGGIKWGPNLANYGILKFYRSKVTVNLRGRYARDREERIIRSRDWRLID